MRVLAVTNMYPVPSTPAEGVFIAEQVDSLRDEGIEVEVLHVARTVQGMGAYRHLSRRVAADVDRFRPDVVHAMYGGILAHEAWRGRRGRPFVVSFCGSDLFGEAGAGPRVLLTAALGRRASHRVASRADAIVVKSSALGAALPRPVDRSRAHVLPNGVRTDLFRPVDAAAARRQLGWAEPGPHVVFGGQPRPVKRPELARAAVELLRRDEAGTELHVPEGLGRETMALWLGAADVVLLTSHHEGSPNVVKEALACGTRVVSVPVGDVPELLDGVPGCAVVGDDPDAIAAGLRRVLGRPRPGTPPPAVARLDVATQARRLADVYAEAAARPREGA